MENNETNDTVRAQAETTNLTEGSSLPQGTTSGGHCLFLRDPETGAMVLQGEAPAQPVAESILRFEIGEEQLPELIKRHAASKLLSPIGLTRHLEVEKRYVPFWVFDVKAKGRLFFRMQDYKYSWWSNSCDTYTVVDEGEFLLQGIAVDASKDMQDNLMDELEPFDYSKVEPYVPGMEDCPVVEADTAVQICANRAERLTRIACARETTEDLSELRKIAAISDDENFEIGSMEARLVLLPVYRVTCNAEGRQCVLSVNGQTGEVIGEVHITALKHVFVGAAAILAAILIGWGLSFLPRLAALDIVVIPILLCLIVAVYFLYSLMNAADGKRKRFERVFARHISEEDRQKIKRTIKMTDTKTIKPSEGPQGLAKNLLLPFRLPFRAVIGLFFLFPLVFYIVVALILLILTLSGYADLQIFTSVSWITWAVFCGVCTVFAVLRGCIREPWYVSGIRLGLFESSEYTSSGTSDSSYSSGSSDSSFSFSSGGSFHSSSHSSSSRSSSSHSSSHSSFGGGHSAGGGAGRRR